MGSLFDLPFEDEPEPPAAGPEPLAPRPRESATSPSVAPSDRRVQGPEAARPQPDARVAASPGAGRRILTVTELTMGVRDLLESEFYEVWVEGEISNCKRGNTGHVYFTLKDRAAQIRAVLFRSAARTIKFTPADGMHVIARGRLSVYEPRGEYQILCEYLEPHGVGARQVALEQLKKRLQAEGLFEPSRKRSIPVLPRRIGIATSLDGAAIQDIIKVLRRRHANVQIAIRPTRVQGDGAAAEVAEAIRALGRVDTVDVIIVARGGGSLEDLWAFNEEPVARAIAASPVPVISAVGHETDFTIADFVADLRAPTPSAAAEMVVAAKEEFCTRIDRLHDRLRASARAHLQTLRRRVHLLESRPALAGLPVRLGLRGRDVAELTHALRGAMQGRVGATGRRIQQLERRLESAGVARRLTAVRTRLVSADNRLAAAVTRRYRDAEGNFRDAAGRLDAMSPLAVLARGYAVCFDANRTRALRAADEARPGDEVHVRLARGELTCEVREADVNPANGTDRP